MLSLSPRTPSLLAHTSFSRVETTKFILLLFAPLVRLFANAYELHTCGYTELTFALGEPSTPLSAPIYMSSVPQTGGAASEESVISFDLVAFVVITTYRVI